MLRKVLLYDRPQRYQPNNADLLSQIRASTKRLGRPTKFTWVKGHQTTARSTTNKGSNTRRPQQPSGRAGDVVSSAAESASQSKETTEHLPESRVSISINGKRLVGRVEECIRYHVNGYHLRSYLQKKYQWTDSVWNLVDLQTFGRFRKQLSPSQQHSHTKSVYDQRMVGTRRFQVAMVKDPALLMCPCCRCEEETADHVFQCPENPSRIKSIKEFSEATQKISTTNPAIILLKNGIQQWLLMPDSNNAPVYRFCSRTQGPDRRGTSRSGKHRMELGNSWDLSATSGKNSLKWREQRLLVVKKDTAIMS